MPRCPWLQYPNTHTHKHTHPPTPTHPHPPTPTHTPAHTFDNAAWQDKSHTYVPVLSRRVCVCVSLATQQEVIASHPEGTGSVALVAVQTPVVCVCAPRVAEHVGGGEGWMGKFIHTEYRIMKCDGIGCTTGTILETPKAPEADQDAAISFLATYLVHNTIFWLVCHSFVGHRLIR